MKNLLLMTAALALLVACGTPQPAPRLYQLRAAPPVPLVAQPSTQVVHMLAVTLPELLERDALLIPQGQAGLDALSGHRWAEPLRDAVPRVLRQDLAALIGEARVWTAPLPAGVALTRRLRVEILLLHPEFGYYTGFSREYRERAIAAGHRETLAAAAALRALHTP